MSRSGYSDDCDGPELAMWRGRVASATRGKRGQKLFRELLEELDAMPVKRLIAEDLVNHEGEYCTLGVLGARRGVDVSTLDPEDRDAVGEAFDIAPCLAAEIVFMNDEQWHCITPEERWRRIRDWVATQIKPAAKEPSPCQKT